MELCQVHLQTEAKDGRYGSIEESRPVATELHAEASTGQSGANGYHPGRVLLVDMVQGFKLGLVAVKAPVFAYGRPKHLAYLGYDSELNAMGIHTLIF